MILQDAGEAGLISPCLKRQQWREAHTQPVHYNTDIKHDAMLL